MTEMKAGEAKYFTMFFNKRTNTEVRNKMIAK